VTLGESFPRVLLGLLEAQRDAALVAVDFQHHHVDFLRGRHDLAGVDVLLGPAHFRNVHQAFDARLQLHEGAVFGDVGDSAAQLGADGVLGDHAIPRIAFQLLHAQADALRILVDADDLHPHGVADGDHFARVVDALVAHVGDVQQAVDAAQVNERTVVGDVLDHAVDDLAFGEVLDQPERCSARVSSSTARRDTTMLPRRRSIFRIWKGCGTSISGVTSRTGRMSTCAGQEGHGAVEIDGEATLHAAEDHAFNALAFAEFVLACPRRLRGGHGRGSAWLRRRRFPRGPRKLQPSPTFRPCG
jgi:hypothetical protein